MQQGRSRYQQKGKASFVYSGLYYEWKRVAKDRGAGDQEAIRLSCLHAKAFRVRHNLPDGEKANDCQ